MSTTETTKEPATAGPNKPVVVPARSRIALLIDRLDAKGISTTNLVVEWAKCHSAAKGQWFIKSLEEAIEILDRGEKLPVDPFNEPRRDLIAMLTDQLRKYWSFSQSQQHTHSWHDREDFITKRLPELLAVKDQL